MKNGVLIQYFEWNLPNDGNLWQKLKEDAKHLHQLGITAVWIPPCYKSINQEDVGYATYDLFDLGEFYQKGSIRTKYGTKEQLLAAIQELHKYQISVYLDAVLNHKIGADKKERFLAIEVDAENRLKEMNQPQEIEAWTKFDFPNRGASYSPFSWNFEHFTGVELTDDKQQKHIYRNASKQWAADVDSEKGNFDYLLGADIDHKHPEVIAELNHWGEWVTEQLELDGMRLDAIKHISRLFIHQFVDNLRRNHKEFYFVGEYWKTDLSTLSDYLEAVDYKIQLFDVPLHSNFHQASVLGDKYDLRELFNNTLIEKHPFHAVTFVDNHDSQKGSALESEIENWFKPIAYAIILLRKDGYPCLFFGDYYSIGRKKSNHKSIIKKLLKARYRFAYGEEQLYQDTPHIIGFVRRGEKEELDSGLAVVISTQTKPATLKMNVGAEKAGQKWVDITGSIKQYVLIDKNGEAEFKVLPRNVSVWAKAGKSDSEHIKHSQILKRVKLKYKK